MISYKGFTFYRMNELSAKQKKFIDKAKKLGLNVYEYSGRGMYGSICPATSVDYKSDFPNAEKNYSVDSMGLGFVIYSRF